MTWFAKISIGLFVVSSLAIIPAASAEGQDCSFANYAVFVNTGNWSQDCSSTTTNNTDSHDTTNFQYCDQHTGAGAGAASAGIARGEAGSSGAAAGASADCTQY